MNNDIFQQENNVLVVEDDYFIACDLCSMLTNSGYTVIGPAATATDALTLIDSTPPHAAVLDVNLGDHRVTPVVQELARRKIPYILTSAYNSPHFANEPLLASAVNIGKPISSDALLAEVSRMLALTG